MTLAQLIRRLQKLEAGGHGEKKVIYRHGSSGDCGPVGSVHVTDAHDDCGPFEIEGEYIEMYVGN